MFITATERQMRFLTRPTCGTILRYRCSSWATVYKWCEVIIANKSLKNPLFLCTFRHQTLTLVTKVTGIAPTRASTSSVAKSS
jgi:hypothetical protein